MPLLLFHGDNALEIDDAIRSARGPFREADILSLDGSAVSLAALSEAALTAGLFAPERLVIVHNLHERMKSTKKDSAETEAIKQLFHAIPFTTTFLLVGKDLPADHALVREVRQAEGQVRPFMAPRKQDLPRWIIARGKRHGVTVDRNAGELLADLVGANPVMLETELEKLATYAGDEQHITPEMVETLVGAVTQESIFALVDSIAEGDRAKALRLLHAQLDHASSTPTDFALYLIRMLARQLRILLRIRTGRENGRSSSQITASLKIPRYYADRYFRQAGRLTTERLRSAFDQLAQLEYELKSGRIEAAAGLDLLVASLCA